MNDKNYYLGLKKCLFLRKSMIFLIWTIAILGHLIIILTTLNYLSIKFLFIYGLITSLIFSMCAFITYYSPLIFKVKCPFCNQQLNTLKFKLENGKRKIYCFCTKCNKELTPEEKTK